MLKGDEFGRLFETFERTAFRLETLAVYDVEDERQEFADFLAGKELPPDFSDNPWVRSMTNRGKQVARVHVLRSPLSDYLRYELAAYPGNIRAGESIGIIDTAGRRSPDCPTTISGCSTTPGSTGCTTPTKDGSSAPSCSPTSA